MSVKIDFLKKLYVAAIDQRMVQMSFFKEDKEGPMYCIAGLAWKLCGMTDDDYRAWRNKSLKDKSDEAYQKLRNIVNKVCPLSEKDLVKYQVPFDREGKDVLLKLMEKDLLRAGVDLTDISLTKKAN